MSDRRERDARKGSTGTGAERGQTDDQLFMTPGWAGAAGMP